MPASPGPTNHTEWFRDAFDADYLARYAHRDASEAARAVTLVLGHVQPKAGAVVFDLCCGAGRHLSAVAEAAPACNLLGGDLSGPLLSHARQSPGLSRIPLIRLDMRGIPLRSESVDLLTNFFTAFGYFESDAENLAVFAEVARVLSPGGWFAFDFLNSTVAQRNLTPPSESIEDDASGAEWMVTRKLSSDGLRAVKYQSRRSDGKELWESVRLFNKDDIDGGLRAAGLEPVKYFGSYEGSPFDQNSSPRLIVLSRREFTGIPS